MTFLNSTKSDWVLRVSRLLPLGFALVKFIYLLLISKSQSGFLHVFALTIYEVVYGEPAIGMWLRCLNSWAYMWASWGLRSGLLIESEKQSVISLTLCWVLSHDCCNVPLLFCAPTVSLPLSHTNLLCILGRMRKKWASWTVTHPAAESRYSLHSNSSSWRNALGCLSWHWTVLPWGKYNMGKVKLLFLLSSIHILQFFTPLLCYNFSECPDSQKGILVCVCQNQCLVEEWK